MELADSTLGDLLKHHRRQGQPGVPGDQLLRYFGQAAAGLDFLNAERHPLGPGGAPVGIQHGDVKPQNLLIVGSGVKVGDFGLLRSLRGSQSTRQTGGVTVAYASPEMFGGHISRHSDQYSLAVAWCELRGGRLPFDGDPMQLMAGHMMHEPDLSMLPAEERPALRRALSKQPEERWPSCSAFVEALGDPGAGAAGPAAAPARGRTSNADAAASRRETARRTTTEPASPAPPRRKSGGLAMAAGLLATLLLTAGVVVACLWLSGSHSPGTGDGGRAGKDLPPKDEDSTPDKDRRKDKDSTVKDSTGVDPTKPKPFTNTIGMRFVPIKPGEFLMGSPRGEEKRSDDETPHRVKLTRGFYLSARLVTQEQWERVMGADANHSRFAGDKSKLPVDNVSWDDCQEFCAKLSQLDGRPYRLPWEAEWEYACRAGTETAFWTGDTISTDQANYNGNSPYGKDGKIGIYREKTTPVDQFPPNPWGLHDMHGNLFQWCQDGYGPYAGKEATDPHGPDRGDRVLRGGSWHVGPSGCRSAYREQSRPDHRGDDFGLRVVTPLDPPEGR
jgi:formylglycine-generating enzyme required for sulfatase activity